MRRVKEKGKDKTSSSTQNQSRSLLGFIFGAISQYPIITSAATLAGICYYLKYNETTSDENIANIAKIAAGSLLFSEFIHITHYNMHIRPTITQLQLNITDSNHEEQNAGDNPTVGSSSRVVVANIPSPAKRPPPRKRLGSKPRAQQSLTYGDGDTTTTSSTGSYTEGTQTPTNGSHQHSDTGNRHRLTTSSSSSNDTVTPTTGTEKMLGI